MAKRFTDTNKWQKQFIRKLPSAYKILWIYILDDCDHAGVWTVDTEIASIKIGEDSMYGLSSFLNGVYGEYGYKDYTSMDKIRVYSPEENPLNMEEDLIEENIDEDDLPF